MVVHEGMDHTGGGIHGRQPLPPRLRGRGQRIEGCAQVCEDRAAAVFRDAYHVVGDVREGRLAERPVVMKQRPHAEDAVVLVVGETEDMAVTARCGRVYAMGTSFGSCWSRLLC